LKISSEAREMVNFETGPIMGIIDANDENQ